MQERWVLSIGPTPDMSMWWSWSSQLSTSPGNDGPIISWYIIRYLLWQLYKNPFSSFPWFIRWDLVPLCYFSGLFKRHDNNSHIFFLSFFLCVLSVSVSVHWHWQYPHQPGDPQSFDSREQVSHRSHARLSGSILQLLVWYHSTGEGEMNGDLIIHKKGMKIHVEKKSVGLIGVN